MKREKILEPEIEAIQDRRIRNFSRWVLREVAPAYFWVAPASLTGRYHPGWASDKGGLIRHTKLVTLVASDLCRAFEIEGVKRDQVVAAAIIHDVVKFGIEGPEDGTYTDYARHDFAMRDRVEEVMKEQGEIDKLDEEDGKLRRILLIAETHLGRWSQCPRPMKMLQQRVLHIADYVSAMPCFKEIELASIMPEDPF